MTRSDIDAALAIIDTARPDIARTLRALPITLESMGNGVWGLYNHALKRIVVNDSHSDGIDAEGLAGVLIHEGTHAAEDAAGTLARNTDVNGMLRNEVIATQAELAFLKARHPSGTLPPTDTYNVDANHWLDEDRNGTLGHAIDRVYRADYTMNAVHAIIATLVPERVTL